MASLKNCYVFNTILKHSLINKLLAKMASDFKPKNTIHTLFNKEMKIKMCTYKNQLCYN